MKHLKWIWIGLLLCAAVGLNARTPVVYTREDSLKVVRLVTEARQVAADERVVFLGRQFVGLPYVAHTLEQGDPERLIVNLRQMDCTTLVENVAALNAASHEPKGDEWGAFVRHLEAFRYRNGHLDGYTSRLHYFTQWMTDNVRRGKAAYVDAGQAASARFAPVLRYMSTHPSAYDALKRHPEWVPAIAADERAASGRAVRYIPKQALDGTRRQLSAVCSGDIVAIATRKAGLDYSHVGIAVWGRDGRLHLLNASSLRKRVVEEPQTLYDYMRRQPNQTGIRLVRLTGR